MQEAIFIKLQAVLKRGVMALTCLILVTTSTVMPTRTARSEPYYFTLHVVLPYPGYTGYPPLDLFSDIYMAMSPEFEKIGIELVLEYYDDFEWWDIVWELGWNHTGGTPYPPGGWDLTLIEWWMMPTGLKGNWIGLEQLMYSWLTPPGGYNIFPWLDEKADELLWQGMHTLDAEERRTYLWKWQEEFMHNSPIANLYCPRMFEVTSIWVEGWDPVVRFRDVSHLAINESLFAEYAPEWRKLEPNTLIYAVEEDVWSFNPLFILTHTEEWMCDLVFDTLYDLSIDPWPPTGQEPPPWNFYSKPALAAEQPMLLEGPNGPNTRARVLLREDVYWSDGVKFNATDVKFTFDLILNIPKYAVAYDCVASVVESVEYVYDPGGVTDPYTGEGPIDPYMVDFILYAPYPDLTTLLSNDGGLAILPWHALKDVRPVQMKSHPSNLYWDQMLPGTGPFKVTDCVTNEYIALEKNTNYFGYDLGWGPYNLNTFILQWMDPWERLFHLQCNDVDFGEYLLAWVEEYYEMMTWDNVRVFQYTSPATSGLWFNLDNHYLSNRYVRQAMAHAIPYGNIYSVILPTWGLELASPGITLITPLHYYTDANNVTVHLFNTELAPFEYDLGKAQQYLNMYLYSQVGADYTLGPVGDADFSGRVDLDDFFVWWENGGLLPDEWAWAPGRDVDPDFDNDGAVTYPEDFDLWRANYGVAYPFEGAR